MERANHFNFCYTPTPMNTWNQYHRPDSIQEALTLLHRYDQDAQIVAGGTDLILDLEFGNHTEVEALVDVTAIPGLDRIEENDGWVELGAAATHAQIDRSPLVLAHGLALVESCSVVGGPQVRNVATIGGNIAHALPAADGAIGLLTLGAEVQVCTLANDGAGFDCEWRPLLAIYDGPGRNNLASNQMLSAFRFRKLRPRQASGFDRIMRPQGVALPILGVAASVTLDDALTRVTDAVIAIGPAGPIPFRATEAEEIVASAALSDDLVEAVIDTAQAQAKLRTSKHRASKAYRHEMIAVLLRRVLNKTVERARLSD